MLLLLVRAGARVGVLLTGVCCCGSVYLVRVAQDPGRGRGEGRSGRRRSSSSTSPKHNTRAVTLNKCNSQAYNSLDSIREGARDSPSLRGLAPLSLSALAPPSLRQSTLHLVHARRNCPCRLRLPALVLDASDSPPTHLHDSPFGGGYLLRLACKDPRWRSCRQLKFLSAHDSAGGRAHARQSRQPRVPPKGDRGERARTHFVTKR